MWTFCLPCLLMGICGNLTRGRQPSTCHSYDLFIGGLAQRNRSPHSKVVFVKIYPLERREGVQFKKTTKEIGGGDKVRIRVRSTVALQDPQIVTYVPWLLVVAHFCFKNDQHDTNKLGKCFISSLLKQWNTGRQRM